MTYEPEFKRRKMQDSTMAEMESKSIIDPAIFLRLQESIDRDSAFRDSIREVTNELDRINREMTFSLAQVHSAASSKISETLDGCRPQFEEQKSKIAKLAGLASQMPYYKFNNLFNNQLQNASYTAIYAHWLGCDLLNGGTGSSGTLLSLEDVARVLGVEVNVGDKDVFHLTIEEYLHSLVTLINELSRLAVTSVTNGNYRRPLEISSFIKDLFSAFQILNLKNDSLRRRYDSIKYDVKKVEEVVYDLSLRGLTGDAGEVAKQIPNTIPFLKVKTLTETAKLPTRGSTHAAGYDMYASTAIEIPAGGRALVCTGLSIAVPEDCYARVAPRSGLAVKNGIQTGAGVVDSDYRGEVRVLLFNQGTEPFAVNVGDRIAQLVLERVYTPPVQQTDNLEESVRGAGGFGSTGI